MKRIRLPVVVAFAVILTRLGLAGNVFPDDIRRYADGLQSDIQKMLASDPDLMKAIGAATPADLARLKPDYNQSFVMQKVDPTRIEGAASLSGAIVSTGIYYVPLRDG